MGRHFKENSQEKTGLGDRLINIGRFLLTRAAAPFGELAPGAAARHRRVAEAAGGPAVIKVELDDITGPGEHPHAYTTEQPVRSNGPWQQPTDTPTPWPEEVRVDGGPGPGTAPGAPDPESTMVIPRLHDLRREPPFRGR
jgi:hypothetical protein